MNDREVPDPRAAGEAVRSLVLFLSALAIAGAATGQPIDCTNDPRNVFRFENCGFRSGIGGWTDLVGTAATFNAGEGDPAPGSYQIDSIVPTEDDSGDDGDREVAVRSPCVPIVPSSTYQVEARFRIVDPSDAVQCGFFVAGYSDAACSGAPNGMDSPEIRVSGTSWASLSETYVSRPADSSMEIFAFCYEDPSGPVFTILMDNFIAGGPVSRSPIFSDGFESGDASAWSRTVP